MRYDSLYAIYKSLQRECQVNFCLKRTMIVLRTRLFSLRISAKACEAFSTVEDKPKYWHAKFPDKRPRNFDEMPTVTEPNFNSFKRHEIYPRWFKEHGYIVRQALGKDAYIVHTCHFEDISTIRQDEIEYIERSGKQPQRFGHMVLKDYRESNTNLHDNKGLGPSDGNSVKRIRTLISNNLGTMIEEKLERVADDLIELLQTQIGEGGEIELLPWLFRWGFENVGLKFLDKRLGALSGNDEVDKMVEAAASINEMITLTSVDPINDYSERYKKVEAYFYRVVKRYIDEIALDSKSKSALRRIMENPKDATNATMNAFLGVLQTVPLLTLMAFVNLARNNDVQVQARKELMEYMPTKDMKYCSSRNVPDIIHYILWETLRLNHPIIGRGSIIKSDMVLGGYMVPKETNVILHIHVANKLEEFFEDPLKFNPNRFHEAKYNRVKMFYSIGSWRSCIGFQFASDTLTLILLKMLRNFELSYDGGEISMSNRLHNEPEHPVIFKLKPLPK